MPFAEQMTTLRGRDFTLNRPAWLADRKLARSPVPAEQSDDAVAILAARHDGTRRVGRVAA